MTGSDLGSLVGAVVALAALIVSLISLYKTNKFNARQNELAETTERLTQLQIERETTEGDAAKKADISANLINVSKNNYRLKVFNRGKAVARNVRLTDLDESSRSFLIKSDIADRFPIPILDQHQAVELIAAIHLGSPRRAHIKLQWDDAAGTDHEKELTPSL